MKIDVKIDTRGLEALALKEARRLAFDTAEALNNTAKAGQASLQKEIAEVMTLRKGTDPKSSFLLRQVKIAFASAKKGLAYAEVYIAKRDRLLLGAFDTIGFRRGGFVGDNVAVPHTEVARQGGQIKGTIKPELTFRQMKLKGTGRYHDGMEIREGAAGLFQTKTDAFPDGAVFRRTGPGKDDIEVVWAFKKPMRLKRLIHAADRIGKAMRDKFAIEWTIARAKRPK